MLKTDHLWSFESIKERLSTFLSRRSTKWRIRDAQECFKVASECPEVASELVQDIFEFFALFLFLFIILARKIACKSIFQRTLRQLGLVASKYEGKSRCKSNFQCVSRVCLMSRDMFLQSAFWFGFLPSKPCLFPWNLAWNSFYTVENPISLQVKFPADRSKFQFSITAGSMIIFTRTVLPCLCFFFLNLAAEIILNMLFNTLLFITPHNTQKRRRKERAK